MSSLKCVNTTRPLSSAFFHTVPQIHEGWLQKEHCIDCYMQEFQFNSILLHHGEWVQCEHQENKRSVKSLPEQILLTQIWEVEVDKSSIIVRFVIKATKMQLLLDAVVPLIFNEIRLGGVHVPRFAYLARMDSTSPKSKAIAFRLTCQETVRHSPPETTTSTIKWKDRPCCHALTLSCQNLVMVVG